MEKGPQDWTLFLFSSTKSFRRPSGHILLPVWKSSEEEITAQRGSTEHIRFSCQSAKGQPEWGSSSLFHCQTLSTPSLPNSILAIRLSKVIGKLVRSFQSTFIPGRQLADGAVLAGEILAE